jgi:hypothetical protein
MRLSQEAIQEFKKIYRREYGQNLSNVQAREMAERFMNLMEIICRPIPGVDLPIDDDKAACLKPKQGCFDRLP